MHSIHARRIGIFKVFFHYLKICIIGIARFLGVKCHVVKRIVTASKLRNMAVEMQLACIETAIYTEFLTGTFTRTVLNTVRATDLLHCSASEAVQMQVYWQIYFRK